VFWRIVYQKIPHSVLLIEAGGPDKNSKPIFRGGLKLNCTAVDWAYETEPQEHVLNRRIFLPRGKTLGGSSSQRNGVRAGETKPITTTGSETRVGVTKRLSLFQKKSEHNEQTKNDFHGKDVN
jgi:choline dehydrogenase